MVNTCSLRGDWSTANLFTHRLTTQEPLFLPLPPILPSSRYLTFPSLGSSASPLLPSSSRLLLATFVFSKLAQMPTSHFLTYVSSPTSSHNPKLSLCPPPPSCLLLTDISPSVPLPRLSEHFFHAFFFCLSSFSLRHTRIGICSVSVSFCGLRYFS